MKYNYKKVSISKIIYLAFVLLFLFNCYYFFIRREVGPLFYFKKLFQSNGFTVLELPIYLDLRQEYAILNNNYRNEEVIVFLGDSITKRFNLRELYGNKSILNRGIFSDTTFGVLERLEDNINNLNIKKLFIMIGYNDLRLRDNQEILNNISNILSKAKADRLFFQSLLPVNAERQKLNKRIVYLNEKIKQVTIKKGCIYIDLHSRFVNEKGGMDKKYSRDGTHPNIEGYKLWYSIIKPILSKCDHK